MENNNKLFSEFKPSTYEEWKEESIKLLKGAPTPIKDATPENVEAMIQKHA